MPWRVVSNGRLARTTQAYIAVERVDIGGGKRYVASVMSSGRIGCVPVAAK